MISRQRLTDRAPASLIQDFCVNRCIATAIDHAAVRRGHRPRACPRSRAPPHLHRPRHGAVRLGRRGAPPPARARLDGIYFHLYGLGRDDARYILGTFPIVRREDEAAFGRHRTRDLILAYINALTAGDAETVVAV